MGGSRVGGVAGEVASFTAVTIDAPHGDAPTAPPPPPVSDGGTDITADDCIYPATDVAQFEKYTFADIISKDELAVVHDAIHLQRTHRRRQRRSTP
ncbi:hypothetical protein CYMTET_6672 [Cymbomonas tetramitiformis]|uniref:Uncharacterized protein n=1 Tax=Cymbomonas tetramitiformis TaxID=36881 RepID=A0AAE0LHT4_9CHLO|nr:hypothetical protein CYMTET_6672 [Cymbomonas tetramitiformis]